MDGYKDFQEGEEEDYDNEGYGHLDVSDDEQ